MKSCDQHQDCVVVFDPTQWQNPCPICTELERLKQIIRELRGNDESTAYDQETEMLIEGFPPQRRRHQDLNLHQSR